MGDGSTSLSGFIVGSRDTSDSAAGSTSTTQLQLGQSASAGSEAAVSRVGFLEGEAGKSVSNREACGIY